MTRRETYLDEAVEILRDRAGRLPSPTRDLVLDLADALDGGLTYLLHPGPELLVLDGVLARIDAAIRKEEA